MNKFQTLIKCRNLWAYMAITGSGDKEDYKPARRWAFECPCCMYAGAIKIQNESRDENRDCNKCILNNYAWDITYTKRMHCVYAQNSFYSKWETREHILDRQYWAMRMVQACDKAIENYIINKK